jgi:amino acid adenylation domain-containing protein
MNNQSNAVFCMSPQQERVWLAQGQSSWNAGCLVRLEGPVNHDRLRQALYSVMARQEALRTVYRFQAGIKVPFQAILEPGELGWEFIDLSMSDPAAQQEEVEALFRREQNHRFNFEVGPVLFALFVRLSADRGALILSLPALSGDARSLATLIRETGVIYACEQQRLSDEPLRYTQFAQWQKDLLESDDGNARAARAYWNQQNPGGEAALVLPEDCAKSDSFRPESIGTTLQPAIVSRIDQSAERYTTSTAGVLLAAWQCLLWRLSGQSHFSTGVYFDGREYEELENAVGAIGKFLPFRARFDGNYSFQDILEHVRGGWRGAMQWQEYFASEAGTRDASPVCFEYSDLPSEQIYGDVMFAISLQSALSERFRLKLSVQRSGPAMKLEFHYDASRFERETLQRWAGHFQTLLSEAIEHSDVSVSRLALLTDLERRRLLEDWNRTEAEYPKERCIQGLFETQVARTPQRQSVRSGDVILTYRELNDQANQLANYLRRVGVRPHSLVALCVSRSVDMIVGVLAVLKAGCAYVPVSAENPKSRLAQQLAGTAALITETKFSHQMPELSCPCVCLDSERAQISQEPRNNPEVSTTPENLAYVIFTSGSTGAPKGVCVRHRNLVNYVTFICHLLELERHANGLHFATVSTLSADLGNTCIFPALLSGGCLHVISQDTVADSARMAQYQLEHPIDVLKIVPSQLEVLLDSSEGPAVLPRKHLILGGEPFTVPLLERIRALAAECEIVNHYGPTETTVGSLTLQLKYYDAGRKGTQTIPIGRPISNTQIYILDSHMQAVPIGVAGELYIAGAGVTGGYLNQPELTCERFLDNPYRSGKMYRTGDLARYHGDGNVEFLGRSDDQVKIRGFRIELGEVETVLAQHSGVKQVTVLAKPDPRGDKRLIAYLAIRREQPVSSEELRAYAKEYLPEYMIPAVFVVLPTLPLTANGKIDRQNLPEPEQVQASSHVAPRNPTEEAVAAIWAEVFRTGNIGVQDNFFQIGGHSLMATQVISRVRDRFQVILNMREVFEKPTIEGMAEGIEAARQRARNNSEPEIVAVSRERYRRQ